MTVFLYRPSPQIPKPTSRAAIICFDACATNIRMHDNQMDNPQFDITWIFLQTLFMAVNTLLWTVSYQEVRNLHPKEELEELLDLGIGVMVRCTDRWPGSRSAAQLYEKLGRACFRSYSVSHPPSSVSAASPGSLTDAASPNSDQSGSTPASITHSQQSPDPPPIFSYVFDQAPDNFAATDYHNTHPPPALPIFRSNSIFVNPPATRMDRRFSYFPPDFTQLPGFTNAWEPLQPAPDSAAASLLPQQQPPPIPLPMSSSAAPMPNIGSVATGMADMSYFMPPVYSFGPHMYANEPNYPQVGGRADSLSHAQQLELMQSLEKDGLNNIDSFLGLTPMAYDTTTR